MKEYRDEKGNLHRKDGPAFEQDDGFKSWWISGKRHRENGPAIEYIDGWKGWFWKDKWIMNTRGLVADSQIKEFKLRIIS